MTDIGQATSVGRVNDHLVALKYIFRAQTKWELIKTALSHNYHLSIPRQFLKHGSYPLEDELLISEV